MDRQITEELRLLTDFENMIGPVLAGRVYHSRARFTGAKQLPPLFLTETPLWVMNSERKTFIKIDVFTPPILLNSGLLLEEHGRTHEQGFAVMMLVPGHTSACLF